MPYDGAAVMRLAAPALVVLVAGAYSVPAHADSWGTRLRRFRLCRSRSRLSSGGLACEISPWARGSRAMR